MTPLVLAVVVASAVGAATSPWWWGRARSRPTGARRVLRRATAGRPPAPLDPVLLLDLIDVAIATGASVPRALAAVGAAVGGEQGDALARGATGLLLGSSWHSAWSGAPVADVVDVLETSWTTGSAPGPALRGRADQLRRERRARTAAAAGSLGVQLVLPLGLCFLPAFVLLGLVPMLLSLAGDLLG
ncbi:secretion system protein [Cellulomonas humilata]|uniref:Secretion system protein n=1 Tax=Cellulomonas humilata TaxID=144055 RepID=A0A7Y5ZYZ7_9CELL|nr:secretion system protein [Cellulomonas humilata]